MCHKQIMSDVTNKTKSPRSPWRRNRNNIREPIRPRLSRRIITTARVNLNSYWSRFEEQFTETTQLTTQLPPMYSTFHDNEINENLVNELMELCNK